jgi:hypothetical protein
LGLRIGGRDIENASEAYGPQRLDRIRRDQDMTNTWTMSEPICELHSDGDGTLVLVDSVRIAKRRSPNTAQAKSWITLDPGWIVRDIHQGKAIEDPV